MRITLFFLCIICTRLAFSQDLKELRHSATNELKYDFYITFSEKKVKYEDTLHYYWFKAQKIHVTQGNSDGNLIHGDFKAFYYSGQLAEKGVFDKGLKDGLWKTWYESGKLKTIYNYSSGILSGEYILYNESGDIRETGKIRKGEKSIKSAKEKKEKKDKKEWGTKKLTEEQLIEKAKKNQEREQKIKDRKYRREQEGNFIERLLSKDKKVKEKKPDKEKKDSDKKPAKEKEKKE